MAFGPGSRNITLADVYLALDESLLPTRGVETASECSVEHALYRRVAGVMKGIEESLIARLSETSNSEVRG